MLLAWPSCTKAQAITWTSRYPYLRITVCQALICLHQQEEADLAAALFAELRAVLLRVAAEGRLKRGCAVGVITFYKAQARPRACRT